MPRRRRFVPYPRPKQPKQHIHVTRAFLDQFSVTDIKKLVLYKDQYLKYHWDYYWDLAYQRSKIIDKLKVSLLRGSQKDFPYQGWQRAIKWKYATEPLSVKGSLIDPGGRFNIGGINSAQFPPFPALYLASDKDTAIQELLTPPIAPTSKKVMLDPLDLALTDASSITIVSLSGHLNTIINLKEPQSLQQFVDLIKDFTVSEALKNAAKAVRENEPVLIRTVPMLIDALLHPNWRLWPMQFDLPATPQIFGQLVCETGIEGILYTSKYTSKDCLAIFPQNFEEGSFIELDDETPPGTKICRLDHKTVSELRRGLS